MLRVLTMYVMKGEKVGFWRWKYEFLSKWFMFFNRKLLIMSWLV